MTKQEGCIFCNEEKVKHYLDDGTPCNTCIYDDEFCFAILAPEQYTIGHTLVVLKDHKIDVTDQLSKNALSRFMWAVHDVAARLKQSAQDNHGEYPQRIYVSMLGDGFKHLHAHLIPRYPFTEEDKAMYKATFSGRDGDRVDESIASGDMGGFWYVAEREKSFGFAKKPGPEKAAFLSNLAQKLRCK